MFKCLKRLFKRKRYANIYSDECVINARQQEAFTAAHKRVMDALEEMEASEVSVTEEEVGEAVAKAIGERFRYLQEKMKHTTNCPNCGAPLHGNKCDYCGTEL